MTKNKNFFAGIRTEWKQIVWPGKKDVAKKGAVVLVAMAVLGVVIAFWDYGVQQLINLAMGL